MMFRSEKFGTVNHSRRDGFTLAELLIVVTLIGLLSALLSGGYRGLLPVARQEVAAGKARALNAARTAYALAVPGAPQAWSASASDADRVALLIAAEVLEGRPEDYLNSPGGYSISVSGSVRSPTILRRQGAEIAY